MNRFTPLPPVACSPPGFGCPEHPGITMPSKETARRRPRSIGWGVFIDELSPVKEDEMVLCKA
jgi:hypothetical protein